MIESQLFVVTESTFSGLTSRVDRPFCFDCRIDVGPDHQFYLVEYFIWKPVQDVVLVEDVVFEQSSSVSSTLEVASKFAASSAPGSSMIRK